MGKKKDEYERLLEKHADLIELIRQSLSDGSFIYRMNGSERRACEEHVNQSLEDTVNHVFSMDSSGSAFKDNGAMCGALQCLIFQRDAPRIEFLRGLELEDGRRFILEATSPRIIGMCAELDHGILRAGITHSARAVFAVNGEDGAYGRCKLVTCFPDADEMEPMVLSDLAKIVRDCPIYRDGTDITRLWAEFSVEPAMGQLATYHTDAGDGRGECLEIDLMDCGVVHRIMATEDSITWQMCRRRGYYVDRAIDRLHVLNDSKEIDCLSQGPYARLIGEVYDRCVRHIHAFCSE